MDSHYGETTLLREAVCRPSARMDLRVPWVSRIPTLSTKRYDALT
jgi:hypothetical protein